MASKRDPIPSRKTHPLRWIVEEWEGHPTFLEKRMFGCHAAYLHGRMMLVLADGEEPWNGLLVCTSRAHHGALREAFPALSPHPVLGKWLYLSGKHESFESLAPALAKRARRNDPLLGIEPGTSKPARKKAKKSMEVPKTKPAFARKLQIPRPKHQGGAWDLKLGVSAPAQVPLSSNIW